MSYMVPEVLGPHVWVLLEDTWYPMERGDPGVTDYQLAAQCAEEYGAGYASDMEMVEVQRGAWGARMTAPGYMDSTEWSVASTRQGAIDALCEYHGAVQCPRCGEVYNGSEDTRDGLYLSDCTRWPCDSCEEELPMDLSRGLVTLRERLARGPVDGPTALALADSIIGLMGMLAALHNDCDVAGDPEDIPSRDGED
jgi:hypothetical protein